MVKKVNMFDGMQIWVPPHPSNKPLVIIYGIQQQKWTAVNEPPPKRVTKPWSPAPAAARSTFNLLIQLLILKLMQRRSRETHPLSRWCCGGAIVLRKTLYGQRRSYTTRLTRRDVPFMNNKWNMFSWEELKVKSKSESDNLFDIKGKLGCCI